MIKQVDIVIFAALAVLGGVYFVPAILPYAVVLT